jgi:hypothetical protein
MSMAEHVRQGEDESRQLLISLYSGPGSESEEIEELSRRLRAELLRLDVASLRPVPGPPAPEGAKAGDPASWSTLLLTLAASGGVVTTVIGTLRDWLLRQPAPAVIEVSVGGDSIKLEGNATEEERRRLVEAYRPARSVSAVTAQRFALLVASYRHQDPDLSQLAAPAEDAEALARVLADPAIGGFDVQAVINQPSHLMARTVEEFFADRSLDDLLLFYFTGHGLKDEQGRLFFATALSAVFVNEVMDQSRARRNVLLLDCCYSGAFAAGRSAKGDPSIHTPERFRSKGRAVRQAYEAGSPV